MNRTLRFLAATGETGAVALALSAALQLGLMGPHWWQAVLVVLAALLWLGAWAGQRAEKRADAGSFNCASCGAHQPTPSTILTLGGRFPAEDRVHAGVCVVWCRACSPLDCLHGVLLVKVREYDAEGAMRTLGAIATRGPGRVTWLSQTSLDRIRDISGQSSVRTLDAEALH